MPVRSHNTAWVSTTVVSWRLLAQRFSFVFFLVFSLGLLVLGHSKPFLVDNARLRVMDGVAPVLDALSRPMILVQNGMQRAADYFRLKSENEKLRQDVAQLTHWQNVALAMDNENKELRALLHYKPEAPLAYISARVIGDTGGAYVRSLIVTAGSVDGVRDGMAAMTGDGLIGRVVEVGDWSSRILLITDMNSRLPVTVTGSGDHAVLAGDNGVRPKLLYLPQDAVLKAGMRVITSGHGGIFPPNLPVGVVVDAGHGAYEVAPLASLGRINQVQLVDFNLTGGAFNPIAARVSAGTPSN